MTKRSEESFPYRLGGVRLDTALGLGRPRGSPMPSTATDGRIHERYTSKLADPRGAGRLSAAIPPPGGRRSGRGGSSKRSSLPSSFPNARAIHSSIERRGRGTPRQYRRMLGGSARSRSYAAPDGGKLVTIRDGSPPLRPGRPGNASDRGLRGSHHPRCDMRQRGRPDKRLQSQPSRADRGRIVESGLSACQISISSRSTRRFAAVALQSMGRPRTRTRAPSTSTAAPSLSATRAAHPVPASFVPRSAG